jgi:hypothetical protein
MNSIITKMDGERLTKKSEMFDKILVDAPCSGTGTIRRNFKIAEMWSPGLVKRMASYSPTEIMIPSPCGTYKKLKGNEPMFVFVTFHSWEPTGIPTK